MFRSILKHCLFLTLFWCGPLNSSFAQSQQVGVELSGALSAIVPKNFFATAYSQRIIPEVGLFYQVHIAGPLSLRTGLRYSLRGFNFEPQQNPYNQDAFWDMHCLSVPLLLLVRFAEVFEVGLGADLAPVVYSNVPLVDDKSTILVGLRGHFSYHLNPQFSVGAYYCYGLTRLLEGWLPQQQVNNFYLNILSGIQVSYSFWQKPSPKEAAQFCPPFL